MDKLISIIIPVYNVEDYLDECIKSVVGQTYESLEIFLVDDGSTDDSGRICDKWAGRDNRIVVLHRENGGVSEARNAALDLIKGDYVGFADADDWCEPGMYETLITAAIKEGADIVMCGFVRCDSYSGKKKKKSFIRHDACSPDDAVKHIMGKNGYFTSLWNKLFKRESVIKDGNVIKMHSDLFFGEDEVWLYEVLQNSRRVSFVPEQLYNWRIRKGSITQPETITYRQMSLIEAKKQVVEISACFPDLRNEILADVYNSTYLLKEAAYCSCDDHLKEIKSFLNPLKKHFIRSGAISPMRKIKCEVMDACMLLGLPSAIVLKISKI